MLVHRERSFKRATNSRKPLSALCFLHFVVCMCFFSFLILFHRKNGSVMSAQKITVQTNLPVAFGAAPSPGGREQLLLGILCPSNTEKINFINSPDPVSRIYFWTNITKGPSCLLCFWREGWI